MAGTDALHGAISGTNNVFVATPFSNSVNNGITKIDHNFRQDNLPTGRYYIDDTDRNADGYAFLI